MHIVLANQWFPPESGWGGVATYNYYIAHAYRSLGHSVTVITSRVTPSMPSLHEADGIHIHRLLVRDGYPWQRLPLAGRYFRPIQQLKYAASVNRILRKLHREQTIDVIEFAEVNAEGFFYLRSPQAPVVVRCHTPTFILARYYNRREIKFDTRIIGWCEKDMIRRANAFTAPSQDTARVIEKECGLPSGKISAIPNPICLDAIPRATQSSHHSSSITILYVGRLERVKGVAVLAQAIQKIVSQAPNVRFVFAGEDLRTAHGVSQRAELETNFAAAGIRSKVEFPGVVDQIALNGLYQSADICVVPSLLYESFSYTCAQAMAASKPVVATRIGGIPETVDDDVSGIIVTPGNPAELAEAIVRLARDPGLRTQMGRAGRDKVEREFDAVQVARKNLEVYERAIQSFSSKN